MSSGDNDISRELAGQGKLTRTIGASGFFTLSFGCIVGSAWMIVLGEWLGTAGPGGAIVGFLTGGLAVMVIGLGYAELAARMPRAGGEFLYAREGIGPNAGFFVAWFLTLYLIAIATFEGIALSLVLRQLLAALRGVAGYDLLGHRVTYVGISIGLTGALAICVLNILGTRIAVGFQNVVTFAFIAILLGVMAVAFINGSAANLEPLFPVGPDVTWWHGALWIFSTSGMFLNGFQAGFHAIEERRESTALRVAVLSVVVAIGAAALFYALIVLAASSATPWRTLVGTDLAGAAAFSSTIAGGYLSTVVVAAAAISLAKAWNAVVIMASRLIFAQARLGYLPPAFGKVSTTNGAPFIAIVAITMVTMLALPLGRGAVLPIVNMCAMCLALSYVVCLAILLRLRARDRTAANRHVAYAVPGGKVTIWFGVCLASLMAAIAIVEPAIRLRTIPLEWFLILGWGVLGLPFWILMRNR